MEARVRKSIATGFDSPTARYTLHSEDCSLFDLFLCASAPP